MALSVRGVARRYRNVSGGFFVRQAFFGGSLTGNVSLRGRLATLCRQQHSFAVKECVYGWTAAFEQEWSHIRIRIRLNPDSDISAKTMSTLRTTWADGFRTTWSNRWGCGHAGERLCPLTFELQWVGSNQHHTVRVRSGSFRSDMTTWDTADTGGVAAHEGGHMLGHVDEYSDSECDDRSPVNTGTVMDNDSNNVPARLMTRFAINIGSSVVAI
jgi:hypothetical protein